MKTGIGKIISKGACSLFAVALTAALLSGALAMITGCQLATVLAVTWMAGTLATMGIQKLASLVGMRLSDSDASGVIGTMLAMLAMTAMY